MSLFAEEYQNIKVGDCYANPEANEVYAITNIHEEKQPNGKQWVSYRAIKVDIYGIHLDLMPELNSQSRFVPISLQQFRAVLERIEMKLKQERSYLYLRKKEN